MERGIRRIEEKLDRARIKEKRSEDFKTVEGVLDSSTLMVLYELANRGYFDKLLGVVSTGKEANVYWATDGDRDLAVKIYRTSTLDFKKIWMYIVGDPRFAKIKRSTRGMMYIWAEKEYKNLKLANEVGVRVPKPLVQRKNVLIMEFIGEDGIPAPRLKDIKLTSREYEEALKKIVEYITILYRNAELVHSDLSEYNVLWWNEPVLIDLSQAVLISHPLSQEFLVRDLKNILKYFSNEGVRTPTLEEVYHRVTGEKPPWKPGNT